MQFNSYSYLLMLIPVTALFWALPVPWRRWYVLAVSVLEMVSEITLLRLVAEQKDRDARGCWRDGVCRPASPWSSCTISPTRL